MLIGGVVACSLNDYPGRISAVVSTQGCNWRCPWCNNQSLVDPAQFTEPLRETGVLARLAAGRRRIHGVVVTGGEPTEQADLADFLVQIRSLGLLTKIDTNGSRPEVVRALLQAGLLDFVALDIKAPWSRYGEAAGVPVDTEALKVTLALIRSSGVAHQLRTTRWPGLSSADDEPIAAIAAGSPHVWQAYCPPPAHSADGSGPGSVCSAQPA